MACEVVLGKCYQVTKKNMKYRSLQSPPHGFDSVSIGCPILCFSLHQADHNPMQVYGKAVPGGSFENDEYAVFDVDAICVRYLIVYQ